MGINELRVAVTIVSMVVFIGIVAWAWHGRFDAVAQLPLEGEGE